MGFEVLGYINNVLHILWIKFYRGLVFGVGFYMISKVYV
jgi:hypothetical protein